MTGGGWDTELNNKSISATGLKNPTYPCGAETVAKENSPRGPNEVTIGVPTTVGSIACEYSSSKLKKIVCPTPGCELFPRTVNIPMTLYIVGIVVSSLPFASEL